MLSYSQRANYSLNPAGKRLLTLMDEKKSNLCFNPDVTSQQELLQLADVVGSEICLLKTHVDILEDFTPDFPKRLVELAEKHRFMIFEDRKFTDIGQVAQWQYSGGIYHIADWAHITNASTLPGPGIIEGLKQVGLPKERGLILLAEMSSKETLAKGHYTKETLKWGSDHQDFVIGFVTTHRLTEEPAFIHFTPGVKLEKGGDTFGQQYLTPETVIAKRGCDVIIVGRGIYKATDPLAEAKRYRAAAWNAYLQRLSPA